ncbi:MAG: PEP-CTERM sorting domain-containing protein [Chthonomonas sp.]|nr:PEP-CTERM sorting domain-containing protein [Chthonomonas sp.]
MRTLAFLSVALTAGANASFDLILVADNTGSFTGPVTSKVHRYDGDSGVYLGYFDAGLNPIQDLAVNGATNEAFVATMNGVNVYNIGTGALKRQIGTGNTGALKMHNGELYRTTGTQLFRVNQTTGANTLVKTWTSAISDFAFSGNGSYMLYNSPSKLLEGFNSSGVLGTSFTATALSASTGRVSFDGGNPNYFYLMGDAPAPTAGIYYGTVTAAGTYALNNANWSNTFFQSFLDIAPSHTGFWMYGNTGGTNERFLVRMNSGIGAGGDHFFKTPQVTNAGQIAVVLAPEPGTFIAVGVGVAALLKRRKRR